MPRLTITLPKDLHEKICAIAGDNDESLSYTIAKMAELGLLVKESQDSNKGKRNLSEAEEHCLKLIIQMNAIIKNMAAKALDYGQKDFDNLRDSALLKFNDLVGISPEQL
ncbi:hypothetical protein E3226_012030 (plasmid) [Legionella geestiana]|uniref:hypothetical protein n=1 Tax=Legionella geestiana TaxID=45065 RepID=UPI001091DB07|nr:hypothetical protein [Legionella geestiana]QDQ41208.1 hypothetical protein E3226_012030 [Legionella geestiana]